MPDINGFPIGESADTGRAVAQIESFRVPGTDVVLPMRAEIAPLLIGLAAEFHERVEPLEPGTCWGYAYRLVRGGITPSFHSAGIAIDLNAPRHPLGRKGTFSPEQAQICHALASRYGCRWGGDYHGRVDEMHFEIILPRPEALDLVAELTSPPTGYPLPERHVFCPNPAHHPGWHDGRDDPADRSAVRFVQRTVGVTADGIYGSLTLNAVRRWQTDAGLDADGIVGPHTWAALAAAVAAAPPDPAAPPSSAAPPSPAAPTSPAVPTSPAAPPDPTVPPNPEPSVLADHALGDTGLPDGDVHVATGHLDGGRSG
jgi:peptidoglycan hydrolase-like protein with peptidoglycan-binding domain